jgi:hypothetical protein
MLYTLRIIEKETYKMMIIGIEITCREKISKTEIKINRYFIAFFFKENSLNFKENNGNSAFIK